MSKLRYYEDAATLVLNREACVGCGACLAVCPHAVFAMREDNKVAAVDAGACMECGACALNCPTDALSVAPGVGCAVAILKGWITGGPPSCDCGENDAPTCC